MSSVTIAEIVVSDSNPTSDNFLLSFTGLFGDCDPSSNRLLIKQSIFYANDWDRSSLDLFQNACNDVLAKIYRSSSISISKYRSIC